MFIATWRSQAMRDLHGIDAIGPLSPDTMFLTANARD